MTLLWRLIKAPGEDKGIISRKKTTGRSVAAGFDWLSTNFLILRRPGLAGRLEGCGPGGATSAAMVRDARAVPALLTMRAERVKISVQRY
jgi:hypothetical protein